jgi:chemotaxis response regulator CheB
VIIEVAGGVAGVVVDDVIGVLTIADDQIEGLPVAADSGPAAVVNLGDRVIALLDRSVAVSEPVTAPYGPRAVVIACSTGGPRALSTALLAPGGRHLRLNEGRLVRLRDEEPVGALRPRADLTIADAAREFGRELVLVVLTGMGRDGLDGAHAVRAAGGTVLAQNRPTSAVYGMPRAVTEAGLADAVVALDELPGAIAEAAA